jgi:putative tryptophan/tyrosine transport system substrate-binding protein
MKPANPTTYIPYPLARRRFLALVSGGLLAAPLAAKAQQPGKVPRLGYLSRFSRSNPYPPSEAFWQGMRDLGWVDGQNIAIEWRFAEGDARRLPALAAELVHLKVDLIFAETTPVARAAKQATTTIPIVFSPLADPIGSGLVASLARPGGNITGSSFLGAELVRKRLELFKDAVPGMTRVAVLVHPGDPSEATVNSMLDDANAAARALGVPLQRLNAQGPHDFDGAFAAMSRERVGGLMLIPSAMFFDERRRVADLAIKNRLPAMFFFREFAEAGGLMSYGPNFRELFRRAATYVDKILKGAKPADLPVEQATKFELVINLKTAKVLGLTIPRALLQRADEIIQ